MFVTSLSEREVETLLVALRYWRSNRRDGRRSDHLLTREETNLLIAKLGLGGLTTIPPEDFTKHGPAVTDRVANGD